MCLDLAGLGIEAEHGGCIEVVTGVGVPGPRRSITDTPINGLGVLVIVAGHPGRSAAGFPVVASPGVMAGFAGAGDGEGPPQFLAAVGVIRDDIAPDAEFAAGAADNDLSVDDQRHQGQVLTLLVVLDLGVPEDLARFGIKRDDMIVCRRQIQLVLPQPDSAAGRVQLEEIVRQLAFVPPVLFAGFGVEGDHLPKRRCDEHDTIVDDRRGLVTFDHSRREGPHRCQVPDVRRIDLVERTVTVSVIGPAIKHPVAGFGIFQASLRHRAVIFDRTGDSSG